MCCVAENLNKHDFGKKFEPMTKKIQDSTSLSRFELLSYSLPSAPTSMLMMMVIVYLAPFYAAEMGMELAAIGGIFALARI